MAEPVNSETRLFEMNAAVKCGGHFEAPKKATR
jgi:hypothetical protein